MRRFLMGIVLAAAGAMACSAGVCAQEAVSVYVSEDVPVQTEGLAKLLGGAFPQAEFQVIRAQEGGLRELVISDCAPQLALCSPGEAAPWAREGLTLPLQSRIDDQQEIARPILSVCVQDENLFMAPLAAHHRQMAVNVKLLEKRGLGYMLDEIAHPVWYPTEFQQILEEFAIAGAPAMDVWRMTPAQSAAMEAMMQAIYVSSVLEEDGETCAVQSAAFMAGMRWLRDLVEGEIIGYCEDRQQALERFLAEETAIFIDWTQQLQQKYAWELKKRGVEIETRPYPSSGGLPVRSYALTGVSVFDSGDARRNALALQAAAFLYESEAARELLGGGTILADESTWLWDLTANSRGATLRSLLCSAVCQVLEEGYDAEQACAMVQAGMDTAKR